MKKTLFAKLIAGAFGTLLFAFAFSAHADVLLPGNISSCGELAVAGTYTLTGNVGTSSQTCFTVTSTGVVLASNATTTISGNISNVGFPITFAGKVVNHGTVSGDALFTQNSSNTGTVSGNVEVFAPSPNPIGGTVNGFVGYHGSVPSPLQNSFFPSANLWGYWDLNESTNGTTPDGKDFLDRGSHHNNGIAESGFVTINGGIFGRAGSFNGSNRFVQMVTNFFPDTDTASNITIAAWIKPAELKDAYVMSNFSYGELSIRTQSDGKFSFWEKFDCGQHRGVISTVSYEPGKWYYVVGETDAANKAVKLYVNNELQGTTSIDGCSTPYRPWDMPSHIGAGPSGEGVFNGLIDELGIWNRALSDTELSNLYNKVYASSPLYYHSTSDFSWSNLSNWYQDSNFTIRALALPISGDSVYISSNIATSTTALAIASTTVITDANIGRDVTLTSDNVTLQGISENQGVINGTTILAGTSTNSGTINGKTTFKNSSINLSTINGDAAFKDSSINAGTVNGNAIIKDLSINSGTINGNADVYSPSSNPVGGTVTGTVTYHGYPGTKYFDDTASGNYDCNWSNPNDWYLDADHTIPAGDIPTQYDTVYIGGNGICQGVPNNSVTAVKAIFTGNAGWDTSWNWFEIEANSIEFRDNSYMNYGYTNSPVSFYTNSYINSGNVYNTAYFWDNSYNQYGYVQNPFFFNGISGGKVWTNATNDNDWNNPSNWLNGATSTPGDNIILAASLTLPNNITGDIYLASSGATLDGNGHTITGNVYSASGSDLNFMNAIVTGNVAAGNGLNLPDNSWRWSTAGTGGNAILTNVTVGGNISAGNGGNAGCYSTSNGGNGGSLTITTTNLDIQGKTLAAGTGGAADTCYGGYTAGAGGVVILNYTTLSTNSSTYINNATNLTVNGASSGAWNGVFNPLIFYFDDKNNKGTSKEGDWGEVTNWWNDVQETTQATRPPFAFEEVIVNAGNITKDTSGAAAGKSVTFNGTSTNAISINSKNVNYNDSSINNWNGVYVPPSLPATFSNGLAGYWKLDETSAGTAPGGTDFVDSSGNGNNGTANGGLTYSAGGAGFDGNSSSVSVNPSSSINLDGNSFSISSWIKFDELNKYHVIVGKGGVGTTDQALHFGIRDSNQWMFAFYGDDLSVQGSPNVDQWYHLVGTYDAQTHQAKLYLDGVLIGSNTENNLTNTDPYNLLIGARENVDGGGTLNTHGNIKDVAIWNRVISDSEITSIYNAQKPHSSSSGNLVGYWKLDETSAGTAPGGTDFVDSSGNGNNGVGYGNISYGVSGPGNMNAAGFDGSSAYVDSPLVTNKNSNITLSAWFKTNNYQAPRQGIVYVGSDANQNGYGFFINNENTNDGSLKILYGSIAWYDTGAYITDNNWHYGVMEITSGGVVSFYLDGERVFNSNLGYPNTPTLHTEIGRNDYGGFLQRFNGSIAQVSIWDRGLSASEISQLYTSGVESFLGSTTFVNNLSQNNGTTTGLLTRLFTTAASTTRNFLTEGGRNDWIVVAKGVVVDISHAIYDTATNLFKALLGGRFITGENPSVAPYITIISPLDRNSAGDTIKWKPQVNWDTDNTGITAHCYYRMDGSGDDGYSEVACSNNGSDIPRPTGGNHTLYLRATNSNAKPGLAETSVDFTYNNTAPVYTSCGSDLLDEARQYYYLTDNVTGDCHVTANTELRGSSSTASTGFALTGNIDTNGKNLTLRNINVSGTTTTSGGDLSVYNASIGDLVTSGTSTGSAAGNVTVSTSTTGAIFANGINGSHGGNGGVVTVNNSFITSLISTVGGNGSHASAGVGGSVRITNSRISGVISDGGGNSGYTGGAGGSITVSGKDINISGITFSSAGGNDGCNGTCGGYGKNGVLTFSYSTLLTSASTYVLKVSDIVLNGIHYGPWNGVFNPQIYYFSDKQGNGGRVGDWGDPKNWWFDANFTTPANRIPLSLDDVVVMDGNITQDTSGIAAANSVSFFGSSTNAIPIRVDQAAIFRESSSNTTASPTPASDEIVTIAVNGSSADFNSYNSNYGILSSIETPESTFDFASLESYGTWSDHALGAAYLAQYINDTYGSQNVSASSSGNVVTVTIAPVSPVYGTWSTNSPVLFGVEIQQLLRGSSGMGTIMGTAIFGGNATNDNASTTGTLARVFDASVSTARNFLTEGGRSDWMILAQRAVNSVSNVIVNLSHATYDVASNFFAAFVGAYFTENPAMNNGAHVVPKITISLGTKNNAGEVIKWNPSVNWDDSETCEYSYDGFATTATTTCSISGTLPRPSAGEHTLSLRGTNRYGSYKEDEVTFTYNNTAPVFTSCGSDLLDEARQYYYLTGNVTDDCHVTASTTLKGNVSDAMVGYTVAGNVIADGSEGDGYNITLKNIIVTGTTTASGNGLSRSGGRITVQNATTSALVANGSEGGTGGYISVATSTTGVMIANGGSRTNAAGNGGNGGTITATNAIGTNGSSTPITANGGDALWCGYGGDGGFITLLNSLYGTTTAEAGNDATGIIANGGHCANPPHGASGVRHQAEVTGEHISITLAREAAAAARALAEAEAARLAALAAARNSGGTRSAQQAPGLKNIFTVLPQVAELPKLKLKEIVKFGEETAKDTFSFINQMTSFLFNPLPKDLPKTTASVLASVGVKYEKDLYALKKTPLKLTSTSTPPGLYSVTAKGLPVKSGTTFTADTTLPVTSYLATEDLKTLEQTLTVPAKTSITLTLRGAKEGTWNGQKVSFSKNSVTITTPSKPGTYIFTSPSSPVVLKVTVPGRNVVVGSVLKPEALGWFDRVKRFFGF